ncbi:MAG: hypothetical protein GY810_09435 [Aureispira sp.]|nr:hypothetical protein [Aureispira sp.]
MLPIKVKSNQIFPVIQLIAAIIILVTAFMSEDMIQLLMGSFFIFLAVMLFTQPILVVTQSEIQLKNLLGMTMRKVAYNGKVVTLDNNKLMVDGKKVFTGSAFNCNKPDFEKVKEYFSKMPQEANLDKHLIDNE